MLNLTSEETFKILDHLIHNENQYEKGMFFYIQYVYGRRSEEICRLKTSDVDFINKTITFQIVKKRTKTIPRESFILLEEVEQYLKEFIEKKELGEDDFFFISEDSKIKRENLKRYLRDYLNKNSLRITHQILNKQVKLETHDFRRLRGQHLYVEDGMKIEYLQKLYFHNDISTTIKYLQLEKTIINSILKENERKRLEKKDNSM